MNTLAHWERNNLWSKKHYNIGPRRLKVVNISVKNCLNFSKCSINTDIKMSGSKKANERVSKGCLGRVFHFKLGGFSAPRHSA